MATINNLIWSTSPGTSGISFTGGNFSGDQLKAIRVNSAGTGFEFFTPEVGDVTAVTGQSPISITNSGGPIPNVTLAGLNGVGSNNQLIRSTGSAWQYVTTNGTGAPLATSGATIANATLTGVTSGATANFTGTISAPTIQLGSVGELTTYSSMMLLKLDGNPILTLNAASDAIFSNGVEITGSLTLNVGNSEGITFNNDAHINYYGGGLGVFTGGTSRLDINANGTVQVNTNLTAPSIVSTSNNIGFFGKTPTTRKTLNVSSIGTAAMNPVTNTTGFLSQFASLLASYRSLVVSLGDVTGYGLLDTDV